MSFSFSAVRTALVALPLAFTASMAFSQSLGPVIDSASDADATLESVQESNNMASSGGNIFDFSSSGNRAPAPGMPSFAGGPCTGESYSASGSFPGLSLGAGRSQLDETCQRRNWVQTLLGAAQQMSEADGRILRAVAVEVMKEDPILQDAFANLGIGADPNAAVAASAGPAEAVSTKSAVGKKVTGPKMAESCEVVVGPNSPAGFEKVLANRGCKQVIRQQAGGGLRLGQLFKRRDDVN